MRQNLEVRCPGSGVWWPEAGSRASPGFHVPYKSGWYKISLLVPPALICHVVRYREISSCQLVSWKPWFKFYSLLEQFRSFSFNEFQWKKVKKCFLEVWRQCKLLNVFYVFKFRQYTLFLLKILQGRSRDFFPFHRGGTYSTRWGLKTQWNP